MAGKGPPGDTNRSLIRISRPAPLFLTTGSCRAARGALGNIRIPRYPVGEPVEKGPARLHSPVILNLIRINLKYMKIQILSQ